MAVLGRGRWTQPLHGEARRFWEAVFSWRDFCKAFECDATNCVEQTSERCNQGSGYRPCLFQSKLEIGYERCMSNCWTRLLAYHKRAYSSCDGMWFPPGGGWGQRSYLWLRRRYFWRFSSQFPRRHSWRACYTRRYGSRWAGFGRSHCCSLHLKVPWVDRHRYHRQTDCTCSLASCLRAGQDLTKWLLRGDYKSDVTSWQSWLWDEAWKN